MTYMCMYHIDSHSSNVITEL